MPKEKSKILSVNIFDLLWNFPTYINREVNLFVASTALRLLKGSWWETLAATSNSLLLLLLNSYFASYILSLHPSDDVCGSFFVAAIEFFFKSLDEVAVCCGWFCSSARFKLPKVLLLGDTFIKIEIQKTTLSIDRKRIECAHCGFRKWRNSFEFKMSNVFSFNVIGFCIFVEKTQHEIEEASSFFRLYRNLLNFIDEFGVILVFRCFWMQK